MHKKLSRSSPIAPTLPLPSLRLLSRAPSTTFQGPGTHILHWGRHAKEIPAAVGYGRGSKSNSGRPSPLAPTHKRLPAAGALSRLHGRRVRVYGRGQHKGNRPQPRLYPPPYAQKIPYAGRRIRVWTHKIPWPACLPRVNASVLHCGCSPQAGRILSFIGLLTHK